MRALMVVYNHYETDNRVRRYAETLARRGDTVEVICLKQQNYAFGHVLNGVKVFGIQSRNKNEKTKFDYLYRNILFFLNSFWFLTMRHIKNRYDLIHVHSVPDYEVFSTIFAKFTGAKVILDIHDIVPEFFANKFGTSTNSLFPTLLKLIERLCCSFADHVIISNHIWGDRLVARSVKKEKCSVILNYPDPCLFKRTRPKKKNSKFILMYPGTIAWHQGIDIAVCAMNIVRDKNPNVEFHIYGGGPEEKNILKLIHQLNIADHVKVMGSFPMEVIVDKMMDTDLGIVPKRDDNFGGDAFSTKIFEFMAMGVPVLIAETRIDRYYFNDSLVTFFKSGDQNDLAEKILFLASNRPLLENQVMNANAFISENSWETKKIAYLSIVDNLLKQPNQV
jgi:glycosyltransferase involved in cell wall biosynthesis